MKRTFHRVRSIILTAIPLLLLACRCPVCHLAAPPLERQLDRPIVITTPERGVPLADHCAILSDVTGIPIVVHGGEGVRITEWFDHVPVRDVLDAITAPHGLRWEVEDGVVVIREEGG